MISRKQRIKKFRRWLKSFPSSFNRDKIFNYRNYIFIVNEIANDHAKQISLSLDQEFINGHETTI